MGGARVAKEESGRAGGKAPGSQPPLIRQGMRLLVANMIWHAASSNQTNPTRVDVDDGLVVGHKVLRAG